MDSQAAAAVKLIVGNKCDLEESRVCACLWCINWREDAGELHLSSERCGDCCRRGRESNWVTSFDFVITKKASVAQSAERSAVNR